MVAVLARNRQQLLGFFDVVGAPMADVLGDVSSSIFHRVTSMSHRERDAFFGGSALLIAVIQARGLRSADSNGLSDPYVSIVPLDETGHEISEEKSVTRTVAKTLDPEWDEVHVFGHKHHLSDFATIFLKVKDWDLVGKDDQLGVVRLPMDDIRQMTEACEGDYCDKWFDLETRDFVDEAATGQLRLWIFLHTPPPDPQPVSVLVRIPEARSLLPVDPMGHSDPYGARAGSDEPSKEAQATLGGVSDPVPLDGSLEDAVGLEFQLKSKDRVHDDDLGEVFLRFSTLIGDEDSVLSERSVRVDKWWEVAPTGSLPLELSGRLGYLHVDVSITFAAGVQLLPAGWQEAVDDFTGDTYFHNIETGESFWDPPEEMDALEMEEHDDRGARSGSASSGTSERDKDSAAAARHQEKEGKDLAGPENHGSSVRQEDERMPVAGAGAGAGAGDEPPASNADGGGDMRPLVLRGEEEARPPEDAEQREQNFFEMFRAKNEAKRKEEEEERERKLAAMTPEERREYEEELEQRKRMERRKERMLSKGMRAYGKKTTSLGGRGRGRGRGRARGKG